MVTASPNPSDTVTVSIAPPASVVNVGDIFAVAIHLETGPDGADSFETYIDFDPDYLRVVEPVFQKIDASNLSSVTSSLTLLETLVIPYRVGDQDLAIACGRHPRKNSSLYR